MPASTQLAGFGLRSSRACLEAHVRIGAEPHVRTLAVKLEAVNPRAMPVLGDLQIQPAAVAVEPAARARP